MTENLIANKTYNFAVEIVNFVLALQKNEKEFVLTKQLLRSGTSIGANVAESQFAQSKPDFIHKLSIALKEANETKFWLRLMNDSNLNFDTGLEQKEIESIISILVRIIKSSKGNN